MTDQKKPLPTFGDVMLGRAAGKQGERGDRKKNDREERKPTSGEGKPSDHAPLIVTLRD